MRNLVFVTLSIAIGCGGTTFSEGKKGDAGSSAGGSGHGGDGYGGGGASGAGRGGQSDGGTGASSTGGTGKGGVSAGGRFGSGGSGGMGMGGHVPAGGTSGAGNFLGGGGASGASGSASGGAGGGVPPDCVPQITFKVVPGGPAGGSKFCKAPPTSCSSPGWQLTLSDASGKQVAMTPPCSYTSCESCAPTGCPPGPCVQSQLISASGQTASWVGTEYVGDTCSSGQTCLRLACVPEGSYVAHMCGYALTGTAGTGGAGGMMQDPCAQYASKTPTCVDVPFTVPTSDVVTGILDPRK